MKRRETFLYKNLFQKKRWPPSCFTLLCGILFSGALFWKAVWPLAVGERLRAAPMQLICQRVLSDFIASKPATLWPPPCPLSADQLATFEGPRASMRNRRDYCLAQRYEGEGERIIDWNEAYINDYCARIASRTEPGSYDNNVRDMVFEAVQQMRVRPGAGAGLNGTVGMVLGSEQPWVECLALNAGANEVWTFEYSKIVSTHPRLKAKGVKVIAQDALLGQLPAMDWIVSHSSVEHSGLGRYGDALNPDGDKEAMQQAWCMLKPGGLLLLGLPTTCRPDGFLEFNAHRYYGFHRLAYILPNFELVGAASGCADPPDNRMFLLRKPLKGDPLRPLVAEDFVAAIAQYNAVHSINFNPKAPF